jgi:hypothetical protein
VIVITIDEKLFLTDFDQFKIVIVSHYDKMRREKGIAPLTDDEQTNLFLYLRKKHGITESNTD